MENKNWMMDFEKANRILDKIVDLQKNSSNSHASYLYNRDFHHLAGLIRAARGFTQDDMEFFETEYLKNGKD